MTEYGQSLGENTLNIFNRQEDDILFALIKQDNPNLVPELTPQNCYISSASPNTGDDAAEYNTVAVVKPRFGSGLSKKTTIKYNRINLADLFRGQEKVKVTGHTAVLDYATAAELPLLIAETYGLPIREGDLDTTITTPMHYAKPNPANGTGVYAIANNKCFIGQIFVDFSYDFSQSLGTIIKPSALAALNLPAGIGAVGENYNWPSTYGFFGDRDFTEIVGHINHNNNITFAQAQAIGTFMGRAFIDPVGGYIPETHFNPSDPFAYYGVWNQHVTRGKTASLVSQYPWIDTNYSDVKITKMTVDPKTGKELDTPRFFAFHYNWYEVAV